MTLTLTLLIFALAPASFVFAASECTVSKAVVISSEDNDSSDLVPAFVSIISSCKATINCRRSELRSTVRRQTLSCPDGYSCFADGESSALVCLNVVQGDYITQGGMCGNAFRGSVATCALGASGQQRPGTENVASQSPKELIGETPQTTSTTSLARTTSAPSNLPGLNAANPFDAAILSFLSAVGTSTSAPMTIPTSTAVSAQAAQESQSEGGTGKACLARLALAPLAAGLAGVFVLLW